MKKKVSKLLAVILAAAMILSLGLTAGAEEIRGSVDFNDITKGITSGGAYAESLQQASGNSGDLGIFALKVDTNQGSTYFTAFLMEKDGNVYLVCDSLGADVLSQSTLTLKSSGNGGYSQKATVRGADVNFVYLSASGLEKFTCLSVGSNAPDRGTLYIETVNNGDVGQGLSYVNLDFSTMDICSMNDTDDVAIFDTSSDPMDIILGAPVVEEGTANVFAIGSAGKHPANGNAYPLFYTILDVDPDEAYALNSAGGTGGNQGNNDNKKDDGETRPEERNDPAEDDYEDEDEDDYEDEEDYEAEEKGNGVLWITIALAVVAAVFLIYHFRNQNAKPGAVELDREEPVPGGEPEPMDPGFAFAPVAGAQWQIRGISGCFSGQTFPLNGSIRMGRSSQCQVQFPNGTPGISGNHCEITMENGSILLTDLGSSYGTFAGGGKLAPNSPCGLNPGETFTLAEGESFLVEQMEDAATGGITVRDTQGREYRTSSDRMAFGRGQDNKVVFSTEDKSVSSGHCVLYKENGKLYLMDLGSTNGTFFTEENRLKPNTPYRIRKGMAFFLVNRKNTFVVVEE